MNCLMHQLTFPHFVSECLDWSSSISPHSKFLVLMYTLQAGGDGSVSLVPTTTREAWIEFPPLGLTDQVPLALNMEHRIFKKQKV